MFALKSNRIVGILLIIFYCIAAIRLPQGRAENLTLAKDAEHIPGNIKKESESLVAAEKLSTGGSSQNTKEENLKEKFPDKDHQPIDLGKETSSTVGEKGVLSDTPIPGLTNASVTKEQSSVVEEKGTQTSFADSALYQTIPEKKPPSLEKKESTIDKGHQSIAVEKDILQDSKEKGILSTIPTPELPPAAVTEKKFPIIEKKETQTLMLGNATLQTIPKKGSSSTSLEEPLYKTKEGDTSPLIKETDESSKRATPPGPLTETVKEKKVLKPTWDIWHTNPTLSIILAVAITLIAAKIGGWVASMMKLPDVVGNLIMGMVLGNIFFFTGWEFFSFLKTMPFLKVISYFGTLLLLLTAGIHTDLRALLRVGTSSFLVSIGGIIAPAGLGLMVDYFLLPNATIGTKILLAIIICNTSTGLLFAILSELKAINTLEGRVITGATLLTEIIVILTFGVASGIAIRGEVSVLGVLVTIGIALTFLAVVLITILRYGEGFGNFLTSSVAEGLKISIVVILSLLFAFISGSIGLHGVIGAFAAGLFLRNVKLKDSDNRGYSNIERIIRPYYMILVPILFVRVGAQVDLKSFLDTKAVLLGLAITGAAILGKIFCSVCPIERGIKRIVIGIGMAMKLEGTLILSGIGRDMGILDDVVFSSIIMVIVLTSTICPSLLKTVLSEKKLIRSGSPLHATEKKELEKIL